MAGGVAAVASGQNWPQTTVRGSNLILSMNVLNCIIVATSQHFGIDYSNGHIRVLYSVQRTAQ